MKRLFRLLFTFVMVFGLSVQANADLIGLWSGNGNANDSSVYDRDGWLIGDAHYDPGLLGQSFGFNGGGAVFIPDADAWAFGTNPFTIALWANFDTIRSGELGQLPNVFIGQDEGGGDTKKWVFFYGESKLAFHLNNGGVAIDGEFLISPTTFTPATGSWHHYAVTRSGSTYTFYADGASLGTATASFDIPNASNTLHVGESEGLGHFIGRLDEVGIWNEALSASQIRQLSQLSAVPEPATMLLLGSGLIGLAGLRKKFKK